MSLSDVFEDSIYGSKKFKGEMKFADLDEAAVDWIGVTSKYGCISNQIKHMADMALEICWKDEIDVKKMAEYKYGFVKEHRMMYVWGCVRLDKKKREACYRLASIFRFSPKSSLMMLINMMGEARVTREVFESGLEDRKVTRYTQQYDTTSLSFELVNREHYFRIDLQNIKIQKTDLDKIRHAWCLGDYEIGYDVECKSDDISIRISATRGNQRRCSHIITEQWLKVEKILEKQEIPDFMVEMVLDEIRKTWR